MNQMLGILFSENDKVKTIWKNDFFIFPLYNDIFLFDIISSITGKTYPN